MKFIYILISTFFLMTGLVFAQTAPNLDGMTVEQLKSLTEKANTKLAEKANQGNSTIQTIKEIASPENLQTYGQVGKAFAEAIVQAADVLGTKASDFADTTLGKMIIIGVAIWFFGGTVATITSVSIGIVYLIVVGAVWVKLFKRRFYIENITTETVNVDGKDKTIKSKSYCFIDKSKNGDMPNSVLWVIALIIFLIPGFVFIG